MSLPETIPQISLGTAVLVVCGAIACLAMLRGLMRVLWGSTALGLAGFAAFFSWQHAPAVSSQFLGKESVALSIGLPAITFVLAWTLLRLLARSLFQPLGKNDSDDGSKSRRSPLRWVTSVVFSIIPTALLSFGGATLIRHAGSISEIRDYVDGGELPDRSTLLTRLKDGVESAIPEEWFGAIDPLSADARVTLAKLISVADAPPPKAVAVLEEPAIRDLILSDEELRQLAREGRYSEILRDPRLDRMLENDDLREVLLNTEL